MLLALVVVWGSWGEAQPRYQGRTLQEWATARVCGRPSGFFNTADEAIRAIGTNGIPTALGWITSDPSASKIAVFRRRLAQWALPQAAKKVLLRPFEQREIRGHFADHCFFLWGTNAASAIPDLAYIARTNRNMVTADWAVIALGRIGPPSVPRLIEVAADRNSLARAKALDVLVGFCRDDQNVAPLFLVYAQDSDERVARVAIEWLGVKINPIEQSIPILIAALDSKHSIVRGYAARSLGNYSNEASVAVPKLEAYRMDTDSFVRLQVAEALPKIGFKAVTNSGDQTIQPHSPAR